MRASLVGFAALALGLSAGVAQAADSYLIQLDDTSSNDTIAGNTYKNGTGPSKLIQSVIFSNDMINAPYVLWSGATLIASFDNQFNYYESDGKTVSDTVEISGTAGKNFFNVNFQSDFNGPLTALPNGGTTIETGQFQPGVLAGIVSNGDFYNVQIASDIDRVPEPATLSLFGLGLVGTAFLRRRKKN